jgi:hypothetical protein
MTVNPVIITQNRTTVVTWENSDSFKKYRDGALRKGSAENGEGCPTSQFYCFFLRLADFFGFDDLMAAGDRDGAGTDGQSIAGCLWNAGRGIYGLAQRESEFHSFSPAFRP